MEEREKDSKIFEDMLYERIWMREREYVKRIKRNWRENTGAPEGEDTERVNGEAGIENSKGHSGEKQERAKGRFQCLLGRCWKEAWKTRILKIK